MTQQELQEIEERWKFGTNTREDVRKLIDEVIHLKSCGENEWYGEDEPIRHSGFPLPAKEGELTYCTDGVLGTCARCRWVDQVKKSGRVK